MDDTGDFFPTISAGIPVASIGEYGHKMKWPNGNSEIA